MQTFDTVTEAVKSLREQGYTLDFNLAFDSVKCVQQDICLLPHHFVITASYRFEGDTNPSDEDIVYAIESTDGSIRGILTAAYGTYADSVSTDMLQKLSTH